MSARRLVDERGGARRRGPSTTRFAILGPLAVTGPDGPLPITSPKGRAILSVLIAWAEEEVSIDRLTDALWVERPPRSNVKVIHNLISQLRNVLGAGAIETGPDGYVLRAAPDGVDVATFDRLLNEGRQHAASGRWRAAAEALRAASHLWRGPPLEEVGDWPPARAQASLLQEKHRCLVEELAEAELACGRHHEVVAVLEAMVEAEPLRERRWVMLMLALYRSGRQAEALRAFQRARTALAELGLEPGAELASMERDVSLQLNRTLASGSGAVSSAGRPGRLPRPATELVGRVDELQQRLAELAVRQLVTLTGPGGVGKTRLATEIAWSLADDFPDGAWMVELAPLGNLAAVVPSVASALSVQPRSGMTMEESIIESLRDRHVLMVLDNCEHLLAPVTRLVEGILAACPTVTVLTTSREPLGIPGEWLHVLAPLDPATEGVELFCDRAVAADEAFTPSGDDRLAIAAICRQLDGMPLAIELAAARVRSSTPDELLSRLDDRFRLLQRNGRGGPPRHQTLRATVDWSYELLSGDEQLLFDRLSVFAGGFDRRAAGAVCGDGFEQTDVADVLDALVAKSMVTVDRSRHGVRYSLLETLRQYGEDRLRRRGETNVIRDRHLRHYIGVSAQACELWGSPRQLAAHTMFDAAWDNLRAAHNWSVVTADVNGADVLVAATGPHAWCRLNHEHGTWALSALALGTDDRHPSPITYGWAAYWVFVSGDHDRAIAIASEGASVASAPDHPDAVWCWGVLAWAKIWAGAPHQAVVPARRARVAAAGVPDPFAEGWARVAEIEAAVTTESPTAADHVAGYAEWAAEVGAPSLLSRAAFYQGNLHMVVEPSCPAEALASYRTGLDLARRAGDTNNEGKNLLGVISATGALRSVEALGIGHEALLRLHDTRHWSLVWLAVETVAGWWFTTNDAEAAAVVYGHLVAHHPVRGGEQARGRSSALRSVRSYPNAEQLMARGAAMSGEQVVALVLDRLARLAELGRVANRADISPEQAPQPEAPAPAEPIQRASGHSAR